MGSGQAPQLQLASLCGLALRRPPFSAIGPTPHTRFVADRAGVGIKPRHPGRPSATPETCSFRGALNGRAARPDQELRPGQQRRNSATRSHQVAQLAVPKNGISLVLSASRTGRSGRARLGSSAPARRFKFLAAIPPRLVGASGSAPPEHVAPRHRAASAAADSARAERPHPRSRRSRVPCRARWMRHRACRAAARLRGPSRKHLPVRYPRRRTRAVDLCGLPLALQSMHGSGN